jgi:hypothetical protein
VTVADLLEILKDYALDAEVWVVANHTYVPATHVEMRNDSQGQFALIR